VKGPDSPFTNSINPVTERHEGPLLCGNRSEQARRTIYRKAALICAMTRASSKGRQAGSTSIDTQFYSPVAPQRASLTASHNAQDGTTHGYGMKIAALDDDALQLETVMGVITAAGYQGVAFTRANALLSMLRRETFDMLIVDWNLPDRSGLDVIRWTRLNLNPPPPTLLVTSRSGDADIVEGLDAGADDFLAKPVSPPVLIAHIRALLRRAYASPAADAVERCGDVVLEPGTGAATLKGVAVNLTTKEFALALVLFRNLHRALSRTYLLEAVWGSDPDLTSRTLDMHVSRVRTKLDLRPASGFRLIPVYSYGYRLERLEEGVAAETAA
jgi:DNA-binding response OmpR family regulator